MGRIGLIVVLLCGTCWLVSSLPISEESPSLPVHEETDWRRTVTGWEKTGDWAVRINPTPPSMHPLPLGLLMLLLSIAAGVTWKEKAMNS